MKLGFYQIFFDYFHKGVCKNTPYTLQILKKRDGNGWTPCGALYESITSKRKQKEKWMLKLQSVFPYGLSNQLVDD